MEFLVTHKIVCDDEVIPVMAVEGHNGGLVLYTEEEWSADSTADWEYSDEGGLTRLGQAVNNSSLISLGIAPPLDE